MSTDNGDSIADAKVGGQGCKEQRCSTCGAAAAAPGGGDAKKLLRCGACRADGVQYCSRACQRSDWKRHRREECCRRSSSGEGTGLSPLESLPADVFRFVLEHLRLPSMVLLGSCSKPLQREVYVRNKWPWTDLDFGKLDPKMTARLSDDGLRGLLRRTRASKTVKTLSLLGCTDIKGLGLDALRGSRVLEEIDLRLDRTHYDTFGETGLDDEFVTSVLATMPPIAGSGRQQGLRVVQIRRQTDVDNALHRFNPEIRDWFARFASAKARHMALNETKCGSCSENVLHRLTDAPRENRSEVSIPAIDIMWKASNSYCMSCKCYTCGLGECPHGRFECNRCLKIFCDKETCAVALCSECGYFHCEDCVFSDRCSDCGNSFCENCMDLFTCGTCDKVSCEPCMEFMFCDSCCEFYCFECKGFSFCEGCDCHFCADCSDDFSPPCGLCHTRFCGEDCEAMASCDACNQHFCADCDGIFSCLGCGFFPFDDREEG